MIEPDASVRPLGKAGEISQLRLAASFPTTDDHVVIATPRVSILLVGENVIVFGLVKISISIVTVSTPPGPLRVIVYVVAGWTWTVGVPVIEQSPGLESPAGKEGVIVHPVATPLYVGVGIVKEEPLVMV